MSTPVPYYQDDLVTLYHGDCREITAWLAADVLVMDPPYGIKYRSNGRRQTDLASSIRGDESTAVRDDILAAWGQRPALVFGTWRRPRPAHTRSLLVWDTKGALGMGDLRIPWKPSHQEVYVLGHGFAGKRTSDVLTYAPVQASARNGRLHPHQKPVPLLCDLIAKCPPGVIADPTTGVGSTLLAARSLGRPAIGVEIEEKHCEKAAERLSSAVREGGVPRG